MSLLVADSSERSLSLPLGDLLEAACERVCEVLEADFAFVAADPRISETDRSKETLSGPSMRVLGSHRRGSGAAPRPLPPADARTPSPPSRKSSVTDGESSPRNSKAPPVSPHEFDASRAGDLIHETMAARPGPLLVAEAGAQPPGLSWPAFLGSQRSACSVPLSSWGALVACWRQPPAGLAAQAAGLARFGEAIQCAVAQLRTFQAMKEAESLLRFEKGISDRIVSSVLPRHVVSEMLCNRGPVARVYEHVSIIFADICGFTRMAGAMGAPELVQFLNDIFSAFDAIARSLNVEKIKTIGDCYMCATGMEEELDASNGNHASCAVEMALGMLHAIDLFNAHFNTTLQMRIGINSGSVVAGVIGQTKLAYDLWGNTVNIASRMESTGEPGRVHVSEETYRLAEDRYVWDGPRETRIKGKEGPVRTYFFSGRTAGDTRDTAGDYGEVVMRAIRRSSDGVLEQIRRSSVMAGGGGGPARPASRPRILPIRARSMAPSAGGNSSGQLAGARALGRSPPTVPEGAEEGARGA